MNDTEYNVIGRHYEDTSQVPKDEDIFYRCIECGGLIPSVPTENIGCDCGNVFIDKDCWRLVVANIARFEVVRRA